MRRKGIFPMGAVSVESRDRKLWYWKKNKDTGTKGEESVRGMEEGS